MCQPVTPERAPLAGQNGVERGSGAGSPHRCGQHCTCRVARAQNSVQLSVCHRPFRGIFGAGVACACRCLGPRGAYLGLAGAAGQLCRLPPIRKSVMHSGGRRSGDLVTQHLGRAAKRWRTQLRVLYCMALH